MHDSDGVGFEQVKWRGRAGFWKLFSKLAPASREWQVSKLAGELACEDFMPAQRGFVAAGNASVTTAAGLARGSVACAEVGILDRV